jgi:hypothetical protein
MLELIKELHKDFAESEFVKKCIKSGIADRQFRAKSNKEYYGKNYVTRSGNTLKCLQNKPDKSL